MPDEPLPPSPPPRATIARAVAIALEEDLGRGDLTTSACVPPGRIGRVALRTRQDVVLAGLEVAREAFAQVDATLVFDALRTDGAQLPRGETIATIEGSAAALLGAERVALNFLQRLCGIATLTRKFVDALSPGSSTRIADTRKTTPGLRALERFAVRCGGGHNHRDDLSSAILIKDNHIAAAGGVAAAIEGARRFAPHTSRVECEVDTLAQLEQALAAGADIVLLDNFDDAEVGQALALAKGKAIVEVSGGITLERVRDLSRLGVDVISVGALTHSAPSVDLGLDWDEAG